VRGGEFTLQERSIQLRRSGGRPFLLRVPDQVLFRPAPNASYDIHLSKDVPLPALQEGAQRTLPAGTRGTLRLPSGGDSERQPLLLVTAQPVMVRPWLEGTVPALLPVRASAPRGLNDISIRAHHAGINFSEVGPSLTACAWADGGDPAPAGIAEISAASVGAATIVVALPPHLLPAFSWPDKAWQEIRIALASADGKYVAYGGFNAFDRGWAGIIATLIVGLILGGLSFMRLARLEEAAGKPANPVTTWFGSLFIGPDRDPSLSLFQIFFWTVITVWGLAYVYVITGSLLSISLGMMGLLGIAGTGSVLARWIGVGTSGGPAPAGSTNPAPGAAPAGSLPPPRFDFSQMLTTGGNFDLLKLQLLVFTIMIGAYVVWRIADTGAFPELDTNTLLLLGVSQGVYIGGKLTGTTAISRAQTLKLDLDMRREERLRLQVNLDALKKQKNDLEAKAAAGTALDTVETDRQKTLPGDIAVAESKLKDVEDRIVKQEDALKKAIGELGLPAS
jgi:hypothetical protein